MKVKENNKEKNAEKRMCISLKYVITFFILVITFIGLLVLSVLIPNSAIKKNVDQSAEILFKSGTISSFNYFEQPSYNDNNTDSIMLNIIYGMDKNNIIESIVKCKRNNIIGLNQKEVVDTNGNLLYDGENYDMTRELYYMTQGKNQTTYDYVRYWHGYAVILKPLLLIFDIIQIRMFFGIVVYILLGILFYYLCKNKKVKYAVLIILTFIMSDLFNYWREIQGILVIIISLIESILIASKTINKKSFNLSLFITGAVTQYLDFLTTPIITLLLPIMVFYIVNDNENKDVSYKEILKNIIVSCVSWGIGYALLWSMKWVLADSIYNLNIIELSLNQIIVRTVGNGFVKYHLEQHFYDGLISNIRFYLTLVNIAVLMIAIILRIIFRKAKKENSGIIFVSWICFLLVIMYYLIMGQHTYQHCAFTYRSVLIMYLAILITILGPVNFSKWKRKGDDKKKVEEEIKKSIRE